MGAVRFEKTGCTATQTDNDNRIIYKQVSKKYKKRVQAMNRVCPLRLARLKDVNQLVQASQVAVFETVLAGLPRLIMTDDAVVAVGESKRQRRA